MIDFACARRAARSAEALIDAHPPRRAVPLFLLSLMSALCLPPLAGAQPPDARPAPPPSTAPAINRVNDALPSWLRIRGEFRERMEGFSNAGFVEDRDDLYWLSRLRFNVGITPGPRLSFNVQVQDARVGRKQIGPTGTPFRAPFDLRVAQADIGSQQSGPSVRVGRQELVFGEQRLVGHTAWLNAARTFDGARVTYRRSAFTLDGFATSVVRILEDGFDRSGNGNAFFGGHGSFSRLVPKGSVEPYVFHRRDRNLRTEGGATASLASTTVGARWVGQLPAGLDYGVEMAAQTGSLGTDDLAAWAGHWQLRKTWTGSIAPRVSGEFNYASGDENPGDGRRGTFDHLYPTAHDKYGLADQVGWRNIRHLRTGVELTPIGALPVAVNYHSWWLAEKGDALYAAGGALLARVAGGAANSHVGQELDVQVSRALTPQLQLAGGYGFVFPGAFLEETTPGRGYSAPYVMVTYVFLAER